LSRSRREFVFSKKSLNICSLILMTGLLISGPVLGIADNIWPLDKSLHGSGEDHIKGDVFRVVVSFSNRSSDSLVDAEGTIYYPSGVVPYPERTYERHFSKYPWNGHFVDEENRAVIFQLGSGMKSDYQEFYSYFIAEKYGNFDFNYIIQWIGPDGRVYRVSPEYQAVILPDSIRGEGQPFSFSVRKTEPPKYDSMSLGIPHEPQPVENGRNLYIYAAVALILGIALGLILSLLFGKNRTEKTAVIETVDIGDLIGRLERENAELRKKIEKRLKSLRDGDNEV